MPSIEPLEQINIFQSSDFRDKINEIIEAVNGMTGGDAQAPQVPELTRAYNGIDVRLTAYGSGSPGTYEFEEVYQAEPNGPWLVREDGLTHEDLQLAHAKSGWAEANVAYPILGRVVKLFPGNLLDANGTKRMEFQVPGPILFPVALTQLSGDAGDNDEQCSFTYTVNDLDGNELEALVDPIASPHTYNRPAIGKLVAADAGLAYYKTNSNAPQFVLAWCNEVFDVSECP